MEGFRFESMINCDLDKREEPVMVDRVSFSRDTPSTMRKDNDNSSSQKKRKDFEIPILDFDKNGQIQLSKLEISIIQKKFLLLARNRSDFISQENHKRQTEEIIREAQISYKPNIDEKSRKLVKDLHEKLIESQIPHYEFLLFKGREYEHKIQDSQSINKKMVNSECTFFPDTSLTNSLYEKQKDKNNNTFQSEKGHMNKTEKVDRQKEKTERFIKETRDKLKNKSLST